MEKGTLISNKLFLAGLLVIVIAGAFLFRKGRDVDSPIVASTKMAGLIAGQSEMVITYPPDGSSFSLDTPAFAFKWADEAAADYWLVHVGFQDNGPSMNFASSVEEWKPEADSWEAIKKRAISKEARIAVIGVKQGAGGDILSSAETGIRISTGSVSGK